MQERPAWYTVFFQVTCMLPPWCRLRSHCGHTHNHFTALWILKQENNKVIKQICWEEVVSSQESMDSVLREEKKMMIFGMYRIRKSVCRMLVSLSEGTEHVNGCTTESVTHCWCDARLTFTEQCHCPFLTTSVCYLLLVLEWVTICEYITFVFYLLLRPTQPATLCGTGNALYPVLRVLNFNQPRYCCIVEVTDHTWLFNRLTTWSAGNIQHRKQITLS